MSALGDLPEFQKSVYVCPQCSTTAHMTWSDLTINGHVKGLSYVKCTACKDPQVWINEAWFSGPGPSRMIYPAGDRGPQAPDDLPDAARTVYEEARAVLPSSARAACALLRLTLEGVLEDHYPDATNLNDAIGKARADGLPRRAGDAMDVLRFSGNASIHELRREDTKETANALFRLLHIVVEKLITEPKMVDEMFDVLPQTVKAQIEKRDATES